MTKAISKKEFNSTVINSSQLSVVKFKTEWSGPCQIIEPVYKDVAALYPGVVNFFTVDVEQEKGLGKLYGVMDVPTILIFKRGKVVDHTKGLISKNSLVAIIENALANCSF